MKNQKKILVVDDEISMRQNISDLLSSQGHNVIEAADGVSAISIIEKELPDLIILDINLPKKDGLTVLKEIKGELPDIPVIIFTAYGTSERVIKAMKLGAYDYLEKPFELDEFILTVDRALAYNNLLSEVKHLRSKVSDQNSIPRGATDNIISSNIKMQEIFKLIGRIAPTDVSVLIQGESGTGKELIADAIQRHSMVADKPYLKINCGALTESVLESEIFGHEKGSFTGAIDLKMGLFEVADEGTVFLDEINSMPQSLQVKLLRVLQQQTFFRVGGTKEIKVNIRIMAATNTNIEEEVASGTFREDLYYRLNIVRVNIPPLRERKDDLSLLVDHFIKKYCPSHKLHISFETTQKIQAYNWPGNIRELENVIHRAIITSPDNNLLIGRLGDFSKTHDQTVQLESLLEKGMSYKDIIGFYETQIIKFTLNKFKNNKTKTAEYLKMNRRLLYSKINEYSIE